MVAAILITLREGLEAALIVGIVLGYLRKIDRMDRGRDVWLGVFAAVGLSAIVALGILRLGLEFEGKAEQVFEGATMFLAVMVLTWMIYWMRYQARLMRSTLEQDVQHAVDAGNRRGLGLVAFAAVFREGVETALFLSAAAFATGTQGTLMGSLLGITLAIALGYLIYASTIRLNVKWFFNITSALLLIFAAGLFAHGVHEFQEAGILIGLDTQMWDINSLLNENSAVGQFLKALAGYNGNPSLAEVLAYLGYWVFTWLGIGWTLRRKFAHNDTLANS
jgi:high-affinity iron transporter